MRNKGEEEAWNDIEVYLMQLLPSLHFQMQKSTGKKKTFVWWRMGGPCSKTQENVNGVSCLFYLPRRIRLCKQQLEALARLLLSANSNIPRKSQKSDSYILIKPSVNSRNKGSKRQKKVHFFKTDQFCLKIDFWLE